MFVFHFFFFFFKRHWTGESSSQAAAAMADGLLNDFVFDPHKLAVHVADLAAGTIGTHMPPLMGEDDDDDDDDGGGGEEMEKGRKKE